MFAAALGNVGPTTLSKVVCSLHSQGLEHFQNSYKAPPNPLPEGKDILGSLQLHVLRIMLHTSRASLDMACKACVAIGASEGVASAYILRLSSSCNTSSKVCLK